jgi:hypothetical protein
MGVSLCGELQPRYGVVEPIQRLTERPTSTANAREQVTVEGERRLGRRGREVGGGAYESLLGLREPSSMAQGLAEESLRPAQELRPGRGVDLLAPRLLGRPVLRGAARPRRDERRLSGEPGDAESRILTIPSAVSMRFAGLTSQWMIPWRWALARPRATCWRYGRLPATAAGRAGAGSARSRRRSRLFSSSRPNRPSPDGARSRSRPASPASSCARRCCAAPPYRW